MVVDRMGLHRIQRNDYFFDERILFPVMYCNKSPFECRMDQCNRNCLLDVPDQNYLLHDIVGAKSIWNRYAFQTLHRNNSARSCQSDYTVDLIVMVDAVAGKCFDWTTVAHQRYYFHRHIHYGIVSMNTCWMVLMLSIEWMEMRTVQRVRYLFVRLMLHNRAVVTMNELLIINLVVVLLMTAMLMNCTLRSVYRNLWMMVLVWMTVSKRQLVDVKFRYCQMVFGLLLMAHWYDAVKLSMLVNNLHLASHKLDVR